MTTPAPGLRFRYQISGALLAAGIACLTLLLLALGSGLRGGVPTSALWWIVTLAAAALLTLSARVALALHTHGPLEVVLDEDAVEVPAGPLGTRRQRIPFATLRGVRVIGRTTMRGQRGREALYLLHGERYTVLMSELFSDHDAYLRCRLRLCEAARALDPALVIEVDGRRLDDLRTLAAADDPRP